jgi:hypothetical protein
MDPQFSGLRRKVDQYREVLKNTADYRTVWREQLRHQIAQQLGRMVEEVGLEATIEVREQVDNLEAVVLSLGTVASGMSQRLGVKLQRELIKHNGDLVYQQLFNGKVLVLINYPFIEGYGEPRPPKTIAIYRPEELKEPYYLRHLEDFMQEITLWEDYDDDEPHQRIGFQLNFGAGAVEGQAQ